MKTFDDLKLIEPIQRALADAKYTEPTTIQFETIPPALVGRDLLGCAQTGTGKTAAFGLPILHKLGSQNLNAVPHQPLALVLAPSRELAIQIGTSLSKYGRYLQLRSALVYGGVNQAKQVKQMRRGAHILVATPGRLQDLMQQQEISLERLSMFVLDEADRMLDMGFLPDLKRIIKQLPARRQSLFFSATLPSNIVRLSRILLRDPVHVNVTSKSKSVDQIAQRVMFVDRNTKLAALRAIASRSDVNRLLAFTRTKRTADRVMRRLVKAGVNAAAIHGDKSQAARVRALESFRRNHVQVLVATDVAARGIDVDGLTHVVNFDMPEEPECYVHRIGRTGRAGLKGTAISFCSHDEKKHLRAIEKLVGHRVAVITPDFQSDESGSGSQVFVADPPIKSIPKATRHKASRPPGASRQSNDFRSSKKRQFRRRRRQRPVNQTS